ncbi:hypothetical protein [Mesorhizobium sp. M5C.F.Cr.IN.023.01.1.1]|uniref:hypothetical protein n=2 Tax=unclassified Mesorhizobium TaxID=325217 RepID=UPI0013E2EEEB|nr:hypothetical protein [Mesorhizobium sp. M5C.F.Cr.IN.023.01.1.1]
MRMHNSVCLDFDGGSSSKARLDTRITKVGQTNIDELLMDFFWHRVNFFAFAARPTGRRKPGCAGNPIMDLAPNPGQRQLLKKIAPCREQFWHPCILGIVSSS